MNPLREWQVHAIDYFFEKNCNAVFSVPTGSGKTYAAIEIIKRMIAKYPTIRILVVMPKNIILETWIKELKENGFGWDKVGIYNSECKEFCKITLTTTSSITRVNHPFFDFLIADEIHNMGTDRLLKVLQSGFKYKLGLSATPDRTDYQHWAIYKAFDYNVFEYSVKQAMEDNVLNKFEFYDVVLKLNEVEKLRYDELTMSMGALMRAIGGYHAFLTLPNSDRRKMVLMKLMGERKTMVWNHRDKLSIVTDLCKKYMEESSKVVVFSQYNIITNTLFYYLGSEGIKSRVIHSGLGLKEKESAIRDFETGKVHVLLATKMLDEGWNLPAIDIGIILAGEKTKRQTIQRLGRCLRKKEKVSKLFQLYFQDTFEQEVAEERTEFFKELCEKYEKLVAKVED